MILPEKSLGVEFGSLQSLVYLGKEGDVSASSMLELPERLGRAVGHRNTVYLPVFLLLVGDFCKKNRWEGRFGDFGILADFCILVDFTVSSVIKLPERLGRAVGQ